MFPALSEPMTAVMAERFETEMCRACTALGVDVARPNRGTVGIALLREDLRGHRSGSEFSGSHRVLPEDPLLLHRVHDAPRPGVEGEGGTPRSSG